MLKKKKWLKEWKKLFLATGYSDPYGASELFTIALLDRSNELTPGESVESVLQALDEFREAVEECICC